MKILGISAFYHDSAAAIIVDGKIIVAAQEERFSRKKQDERFPNKAIKYCLDYSGLSIDNLNAVVFYDKPLLKFERLLETYYAFAPKGVLSFITAVPVWLREKLFLKKLIKEELCEIEPYNKRKLNLLFPEHHLSHAASAFYPSPFKEAAILTIDGVGEWATSSICHGKENNITVLKETHFPHSLGILYSAFTYYTGFKVNGGEYKLMGLAPYGDSDSKQVTEFTDKIKQNLVSIKSDGSIWLNQDYFNYSTGLRMIHEAKWEQLFGIKTRKPESSLEMAHCNLAFAIQQVTEEIVLLMGKEAKRLTNAEYLCMAGGVALNCVANGKLKEANIFKDIFIQPAAGDAGGALGAALAAHYIYFAKERRVTDKQDEMNGSYLGPEYSSLEIEKTARKYEAVFEKQTDFKELASKTAKLISEGNVIGWFQGKMEFGPRALGNRSILADARNAEMQKKLNLNIKYRESFRPFAPSVLAEDCEQLFDMKGISPYMALVYPVNKNLCKELPADYKSYNLLKKLYYQRSEMPAVTHIDFSARIQTVHRETNPKYWELINEFKKLTGKGVIVNTSFNVRGEPIVCTPDDAFKCFMNTEMDYLVMGDYIFDKKHQAAWTGETNVKKDYVAD